jgi:glycosyltransferase involved in cell wall biosynthesis
MSEPLLSVGIPTYNRAAKLARAVESVLGQTYANLELVISDNASSDVTETLCQKFAAHDARVRYLRAPVNRGPTANFNVLFDEMRGEQVMVLSDDDWLEHDYLAACHGELERRPELVLACGRARYVRNGARVKQGVAMQLEQDSVSARVLAYLRDVDENGVFYGLMRREALARAAPLRNVLGNDWLLAAAVVAQGKAITIEDTAIDRELDGTSADFAKLAATLELPPWQARVPHLVIAAELAREIAWRGRAYRALPPPRRARLALAGAGAVISWRSLAWHLTMPAFAALGRHRHGRWLWRAYARFTRLLGAGRAG